MVDVHGAERRLRLGPPRDGYRDRLASRRICRRRATSSVTPLRRWCSPGSHDSRLSMVACVLTAYDCAAAIWSPVMALRTALAQKPLPSNTTPMHAKCSGYRCMLALSSARTAALGTETPLETR